MSLQEEIRFILGGFASYSEEYQEDLSEQAADKINKVLDAAVEAIEGRVINVPKHRLLASENGRNQGLKIATDAINKLREGE